MNITLFRRLAATSCKLSNRRNASTIDILLLKDVINRGIRGEVVKVRAGYFRNLLYPRKLAVYATEQNLEKYAHVINEAEIRKVTDMKATPVEFTISESKPIVTANDIKKTLQSLYTINPSKYELVLEQPLKDVGEYVVKVHGEDVRVVLVTATPETQKQEE